MTAQASRNQEEARIRALLDDWTAGVRVRDVDRVMSHYATDIVIFDLAPPLEYAGADTLRKSLQAWFSTWQGPLDYEIRDLNITAGEGGGFGPRPNPFCGTKNGGETADGWVC